MTQSADYVLTIVLPAGKSPQHLRQDLQALLDPRYTVKIRQVRRGAYLRLNRYTRAVRLLQSAMDHIANGDVHGQQPWMKPIIEFLMENKDIRK